MTKKNRKAKDEQPAESFEHKVQDAFKRMHMDTAGDESAEEKANLTEAAPAQKDSAGDESGSTETTPAGSDAAPSVAQSDSDNAIQSQESGASDEASMDELLDDVRRSLIEDEAHGAEKKPGWLSRITKGFQKDQPATDAPVEIEPMAVEPEVPIETTADDQYLDEIDELIEMLEPEPRESRPEPTHVAEPELRPEPVPEPEPQAPVDLEQLKKRVFSPPEAVEETGMGDEVRAAALEGGDDVFTEGTTGDAEIAQERARAFENSLRPYRQQIYLAVAALGVVLALFVIGIMYTFYARTQQLEPTPNVSNLPNPVAMTLPGGLNFNLARGAIKDGKWNPSGPEWLTGTEICRWVAIPWSKQLEAVVRTLSPDDAIELVMSNNDRIAYNVYSIQELTLEEMQALDQNTPCLLLVLAEQDAEKRWVVTAKP